MHENLSGSLTSKVNYLVIHILPGVWLEVWFCSGTFLFSIFFSNPEEERKCTSSNVDHAKQLFLYTSHFLDNVIMRPEFYCKEDVDKC